MTRIRYPAAVGTVLLNCLVLVGLITLAQPVLRHTVKPLEVALITAPEPAPMTTDPTPEAAKPPEPMPVAAKPPPPPPKPQKVKPTPTPPKRVAPSPAPVALAPAPTEPSTNTVAAEPAPPAAPAAAKVAEVAAPPPAPPNPEPVREPPRADASWSGNTPPPYPALARRMGEQGEVRLDIQVAMDGTVSDIRLKVSSGSTLLDQTAMETVRKWRFRPATVGGKAVAEWYHNWRWVFKLEG